MRRIAGDGGVAWLAMTALLCAGAIVAFLVAMAHGGLAPGGAGSAAIDWEPGLGLREPWRLWTCAWVHWSVAHLAANLLGAAVVGAVGWRARAPWTAALAWFVAWPLTHLLMAVPAAAILAHSLRHYGGLSGVLHAGVIVLGLTLAWPNAGQRGVPRSGAPGFAATRASVIEPSRITEGPWAMTSLEELSAAPTVLPVSTFEAPPAPLGTTGTMRDRWIGVAIVAGTVAKVLLESPWNLALRPNSMLGIEVAPFAHACGIAAGVMAWGLAAGCLRARRTPRQGEGP
jgi:membrane associated rhomboid family serine protease